MSKQQIFVKHKDEIMIEIIRLQRLTFCDDQVEAEAVNHGKIQGLMWAANLYENKEAWHTPVITGDRDTDALLEDERRNQEEI